MKLRLFIGLPLTVGLVKKIASLENEINNKLGFKLSWIPLKNLHLTILFLGYVDYDNYLKLIEIFSSVKLEKPFSLEISKIDYGPPRSKRMIWLYGKRNKSLEEFKKAIEDKISSAGIPYQKENRAFLPHINLIRLKSAKNLPPLEQKLNWQVFLPEVAVFQSRLLSGRAEYEKLKSITV